MERRGEKIPVYAGEQKIKRAKPCWACAYPQHFVVSDSVTPRTVPHQAPLSPGFSSKNTGMGCHSLLQGIFPTQGSNPGLPHYRRILYGLSHQGSPPFFDTIYKHWECMRRKTSCWRFAEWQNQQAYPVLSPKVSMMKESLERPT